MASTGFGARFSLAGRSRSPAEVTCPPPLSMGMASGQLPDVWRYCYHDVMNRTTLMLPDEVRDRLRRLAAERGVSMATLVREAIDEKINRMRPTPRSLGIGASGATNTARRTAEERPEPHEWR